MLLAQTAEPGGIAGGFATGTGIAQSLQAVGYIGQQFHFTAPVVAQFSSVVGQAYELGLAKNSRGAKGQLEIQLAPERNHHIGLAHDAAAHGGHHAVVVGRHQTAAFAGVKIGRAQQGQQFLQWG